LVLELANSAIERYRELYLLHRIYLKY
jgi:hypothetical protein